jgi:large subunit ribosomal protein L25
MLHTIELECEAASVPDKIDININHLEFGQILHVEDIKLPSGVKALVDAATPVVSCLAPAKVSEEDEAAAGDAEPEVIGRKKTEDDEAAAKK